MAEEVWTSARRRKDGRWVPTAVNFVRLGATIYFRTFEPSGKAKRLARSPVVELAHCWPWGRPRGGAVFSARCRLVLDREAPDVIRALQRKYPVLQGIIAPLLHRVKGVRTVHFALEDCHSI